MKLVAGTLMLLGSEQAFAHAHLVQFPNSDAASSVLMPAALVFLVLGSILLAWGLLTETRRHPGHGAASPRASDDC